MNGFRRTVRGALNRARRLGPSIGLAAVVLTSALGTAMPVGAQDDSTPPTPVVRDHRDGQGPVRRVPRTNDDPNAPPPIVRDHRTSSSANAAPGDDPDARVQILLKTIHVANDRDGAFRGSGEFTLTATFVQCAGSQPPCGSGDGKATTVAEWKRDFGADSGDAKTLDRLMPITADVKTESLASEDGALALYDGRAYMFQVTMFEHDTATGDMMGGIQRIIDKSTFWGVGTYEREAAGPLKEPGFGNGPICAGCGDVIVGDYLVSYQILPASLPDLKPTAIRLLGDAGDGLEEVCLAVVNQGTETAGPFNLGLFVDQAPATNGSVNLLGLGAGASHESCFRTSLPASGVHNLDLIVDQPRTVPEINERNNQLQQSLDRGAATPTPSPSPTASPSATPADGVGPKPLPNASPTPGPILIQRPNQADEQGQGQGSNQADLVVSAVKIRGQVPDGKDDCKEGGNDVSVVVKNTGATNAGPFVVRLAADGAPGAGLEQKVNGLESGKEREVKFEDVKLKKGAQTLTASADARTGVSEANEANNEREVSAQCKDN